MKVGGLDRLAYLVDRARKRSRVLLLDAGDISQGTPVSNLFFGKPMAQAMNLMGYDAAVVGNHEFDWGLHHLETFIRWCRFPILAANVRETFPDHRTGFLPGTRPDLLLKVAGVKVGIIGVVTPTTPTISKPENMKGLTFLQPAPVVEKYIPVLRHEGARIIIVLSHLGLADDQTLAKAVRGIDLIVGGHSHTVLQKEVVVGHTVIVQTGSYCRYLGEIQVAFNGKYPQLAYHLVAIEPDRLGSDPRVAAVMEHYRKKLAPLLERVIGPLNTDLTRNREGESTLGDVIADAMRAATGADVAFQNSGGIRADLLSGTVRWGDVFTVLPFDDEIVTMNLKGEEILEILKQSVTGKSGLIQVSGLRYAFKESGTDPEKTRTLAGAWIDGKPIDPLKTYRVATSDFLSTGGDGFTPFKHGTDVVHGNLVREIFMQYLKTHSPFSFKPSGRIVRE